MSQRLDQERQERLEPKRMETTLEKLRELGYHADAVSHNEIHIISPEDNLIKFWPYSGWHSGKGIKDGRGFQNLLNELGRQGKTEKLINEPKHGHVGKVENIEAEIPDYFQPAIFDEHNKWPPYKWWRNPIKRWRFERVMKKIKIAEGIVFVGANSIVEHEYTPEEEEKS